MKTFAFALLAASASAAVAQHQGHPMAPLPVPERTALLTGYGNGGFPIATANPQAQAFFSNGMELAAAFQHDAAKAAFAEAVRLDPNCVMCAWGDAWANGPTINYGVEGEDLAKAQKLAARASALAKAHGTPLERQMTDAIVARYAKGGGSGTKGDYAFLHAMERIAAGNPAHDAIQVMTADAVLNTLRDNDDDRTVVGKAAKAMVFLTPVLARNPDFTPAIHFYIHASEIAEVPAYAEPYADRLGRLAPSAQHLVHMPSHTYYWIGRYRDAGIVNLRAVQIGMANATKSSDPNAFAQQYHAHNVNFGLGGSLISGDRETALAIARPLVAAANVVGDKIVNKSVAGTGLVALGIFAPDELLALPQPTSKMLTDYWHYARGEALAVRGDAAGVRAEEKAMRLSPELPPKIPARAAQTMTTTYQIAHQVLLGRAAMIERNYPAAIAAFEKGAALEEGKDYSRMSDPPAWWYPVRRSLVEARLAAGDIAGARADAAATLKRRPNEPGTLALLQSIGRTASAATPSLSASRR